MSKEKAFIKMIKQHEGIIYKITRAYTNNDEAQKDLYQEVVCQLWKSFSNYKGDAKVSTWMYRVTLNTSLAYSKKEKETRLL